MLDCSNSPTIIDSVAVNNSLYLGTQYENRTLTDDAINALFADFDASEATIQPNCPGAYCSGEILRYENAGNPGFLGFIKFELIFLENLQIMGYYYGECKTSPLRAFQYSDMKCPDSALK